jgi:RNA polymerase sigma factor (sigma-70 family)
MKGMVSGEGSVNGSASALAQESRTTVATDGLADLVRRAQKGDRHAFEQLYRRQVGRIYAICLRMVADRARAEALTQDAFVRAWEKLGTYRGTGAFGAWLGRLATNVVIEEARRRSRRANWLEIVSGDEMSALHGTDTATAVAGQRWAASASQPPDTETALDLERAIAALPAGARMVFLLHDVEGYKYREVAAHAGIAVGTVKAQLHRARRLLRETLDQGWGGTRR